MSEVLSKNQYNKNGYRHGYWELYYSNGNLDSKGNYNNGLKHDYWKKYWSNGNLWSKGIYSNDKLLGYWEYYWSDGKKLIEIFFL